VGRAFGPNKQGGTVEVRLRSPRRFFRALRAGRPLPPARRSEPATAAAPVRPAATLAVVLAGLSVTVAACTDLVAGGPDSATLAGVGALLAAATLAERFPLPLESAGDRGVTLTLVFGLAALVLFGWAAGTLVFFTATAVALTIDPVSRPRAGQRAASAAVAATAAGCAGVLLGQLGVGDAAVTIAVAAAVYTAAGAALAWLGPGFAQPARSLRRPPLAAVVPLIFMASTAVALVVLWQRSPVHSLALAGPLGALVLYGRSTHEAIGAMALALTDPLTGLGNRRHFQERLQRELAVAESRRTTLSLCLLDIDDFKRVNDEAGHVEGDEVLVDVAARLRSGGEAFRLGGDEFAVLLPGIDAPGAVVAGESVRRRIRSLRTAGDRVTASIGVATFPAVAAADVVRAADAALYRSKELGKDCVSAHGGNLFELAGRRRAALLGRAARRRAAASARAADSDL
jgi:diguanylate cyclase (GGDEF)-like protein